MAKATCSVRGCRERVYARELCQSHYGKAYRRGELPPRQIQMRLDVHSLSNIDSVNRRADCSICGPGVRIGVKVRADSSGSLTFQCRTKINEASRAVRLRYRRDPTTRSPGQLRRKYGLSVEDYEHMLAEQSGQCKICQIECDRLEVDHDHQTGAVRGLLCKSCNIALGWLRDRHDVAAAAAQYLA